MGKSLVTGWKFWNQCKLQQRILSKTNHHFYHFNDPCLEYLRTSRIYMKYAGINTGSVVYRSATDDAARPFQGGRHYSVKRALVGLLF
jgi:hypothetical protein